MDGQKTEDESKNLELLLFTANTSPHHQHFFLCLHRCEVFHVIIHLQRCRNLKGARLISIDAQCCFLLLSFSPKSNTKVKRHHVNPLHRHHHYPLQPLLRHDDDDELDPSAASADYSAPCWGKRAALHLVPIYFALTLYFTCLRRHMTSPRSTAAASAPQPSVTSSLTSALGEKKS